MVDSATTEPLDSTAMRLKAEINVFYPALYDVEPDLEGDGHRCGFILHFDRKSAQKDFVAEFGKTPADTPAGRLIRQLRAWSIKTAHHSIH